MDGQAAISRNSAGPDRLDDVCMGLHRPTVHYALDKRKCLMHRSADYSGGMDTPNKRLRFAREQAGYATMEEAAAALHVSVNTYRQHENDTRGLGGIPRKAAPAYAKKFKVSLEWLLEGVGDMHSSDPVSARIFSIVDGMNERQRQRALRHLEVIAEDGVEGQER